MSQRFLISFPEASVAEGNRLASSLLPAVQETDRRLIVKRHKDNVESLDHGTMVAIVLGSAAVGTLSRGIASWIAKHAGTVIRIHLPDGTSVDVKNATGQDTSEIVQAVFQRSSNS
jgi:hypothetical protein